MYKTACIFGGKNWVLDALKLELEVFVRCPTQVLGSKLRSSTEQCVLLTDEHLSMAMIKQQYPHPVLQFPHVSLVNSLHDHLIFHFFS